MTNDLDWVSLEGELRANLPPAFKHVLVGREDNEDGARCIFFFPSRLLTRDEVMAAISTITPIVRRWIPDKPDRWAAVIGVQRLTGDSMGACHLGWVGRSDEWRFFGRETKHADWQALRQRLRALLSEHGVERPEDEEDEEIGDFFIADRDDGRPCVHIAVLRIEFLTPELLDDIQACLKDGYADWVVKVGLFLPLSDSVPPNGIIIKADEVLDDWDWPRLKRQFGDRLKI